MSVRFDYIAYDKESLDAQMRCKAACLELEAAINAIGSSTGSARERATAMTVLEHVYARCGRAIRDEQIATRGPADLQEQRGAE